MQLPTATCEVRQQAWSERFFEYDMLSEADAGSDPARW